MTMNACILFNIFIQYLLGIILDHSLRATVQFLVHMPSKMQSYVHMTTILSLLYTETLLCTFIPIYLNTKNEKEVLPLT